MKMKANLAELYKMSKFVKFPAVSPSPIIISISLVVVGFLAYLFGGLAIEKHLRFSALATSACASVIFLFHLVNPTLSRLSTGFLTTGLAFLLAWIWQDPFFLSLLVIPVILSAMMVNLPLTVITAAAQTILVLKIPDIQFAHPVLILLIWLAAGVSGGGYYFYQRLLSHAAEDYDRIQDLLNQSRGHQQSLAFALDDLEHANRQLSLLYDKNISLRKAAEEATEAKSTYIARVSHEIRTPLNMILGITESIIETQESYEEELPLDLVDDIKVIRRNSEHLLSLVNDVLDLTRAEASRLILRKEWLDLGPEIEKSIELVRPLAKKKKLTLYFEHSQPLQEVYCDRTRIRQVILNLLSNAVRYTENGEVKVRATADNSWLTIEVQDTGPGIETDDAERIFEPFYRGMTSVKQETVGTGLGLSVCRQLIDLHGGKIWLESRPGQGSIFFFRLPLLMDSDTAQSPARFINETWAWVERKRKRQYNFITPEKKRIIVCGTGGLVGAYTNLQDQVEIVQVDSISQLVSNIEVTPAHLVSINAECLEDLLPRMEQALEKIKDTPIIGSIFTSLQEQVRRTGAIDYVQKPFSNQRIRQAVGRITPYPRRILIVDDNVEVQRLIVRILSAQDELTQYLLADNGQSALEVARRKKPDLILLDLALPIMDGWQFLKCLKEDSLLNNIPVILVSAHDINETPARSKAVILMNGDGIAPELFSRLLQEGIAS